MTNPAAGPLCVIDLETTGLDPARHSIIEIAVIRRDQDGTWEEYAWWLDDIDLTTADSAALRINRFYDRLSSNPPLSVAREVAAQVAILTAGCHLVGAVPSFDAAFLDPFLRKHGFAPAWVHRLICVESAAAAVAQMEPPWTSSQDLFKAVGIQPLPASARHTALGDARLARMVYERCFGLRPAPKTGKRARDETGPEAVPEPAAPAPEPELEEAPTSDVMDEQAALEAGHAGEQARSNGIPDVAVDHECEEQGCEVSVAGEKAVLTWTRYRRVLCPAHFAAMKVDPATTTGA